MMPMRVVRPATHKVERGENGGSTVAQHPPVHAIERAGSWSGEPVEFRATIGEEGIAALVQARGPGTILGPTALPDP